MAGAADRERLTGASQGTAEPEYGSDLVVATLKALGIEYVALNPGASFRGLHDSLVNFGGNRQPEIVECCHEEVAVAIAHGYAAASGRPMAAAVHDIVGLQHATIAIYHAWVDREPVLVLGGTGPVDAARRRPWIDWIHTANVQGNLVRDFTKWDDQPHSVESVPRSLVRAHQIATSAPHGPVYLCYDAALQEQRLASALPLPDLTRYPPPTRLHADDGALREVAERLLAAEHPVIATEYAGRYPGASAALVELAELLGAPVVGSPGRFNLPSNHPLCVTEGERDWLAEADVIFAVELQRLTSRLEPPAGRPRPWLANLTLGDLGIRAWAQDFLESGPQDLEIRAEAGVALPRLVEICRERLDQGARARAAERARRVAERTRAARAAARTAAEAAADESPVALAHLALQLGETLAPHHWTIAKGALRGWLWRLLEVERAEQWVGLNAAGGLGNGLGFSLGVALAHRDDDLVCVDVQGDGDLLYTPSALWTAAHHKLPLLLVVYNNRSYYNSEGHALRLAETRGRPAGNAGIGTRLDDPPTDFAALARVFGLYGEGPITDPAEVRPALERALRVVREERRLALVDVVCADD